MSGMLLQPLILNSRALFTGLLSWGFLLRNGYPENEILTTSADPLQMMGTSAVLRNIPTIHSILVLLGYSLLVAIPDSF
jgi:hypothetical protein